MEFKPPPQSERLSGSLEPLLSLNIFLFAVKFKCGHSPIFSCDWMTIVRHGAADFKGPVAPSPGCYSNECSAVM